VSRCVLPTHLFPCIFRPFVIQYSQ
jgi:hypothetical protein